MIARLTRCRDISTHCRLLILEYGKAGSEKMLNTALQLLDEQAGTLQKVLDVLEGVPTRPTLGVQDDN